MATAPSEEFLRNAPVRFEDTFEIDRSAEEVWAELTRDGTLEWCRGLGITWKSPRPFAVGTKRQAKVFGGALLKVDEEYFIWEEGRRKTFYATKTTPPMYKQLAEDYVVEPLDPNRCRFTWTIVAEPNLIGKLANPVNTQIVKRLFSDTRRYFGA